MIAKIGERDSRGLEAVGLALLDDERLAAKRNGDSAPEASTC